MAPMLSKSAERAVEQNDELIELQKANLAALGRIEAHLNVQGQILSAIAQPRKIMTPGEVRFDPQSPATFGHMHWGFDASGAPRPDGRDDDHVREGGL